VSSDRPAAPKVRFRGSSLVCSECGWQISYKHRPGCLQEGRSASELTALADARCPALNCKGLDELGNCPMGYEPSCPMKSVGRERR
jgi:hypothetical protein